LNDAHEKLDRLANYVKRTGLKINTGKTKSKWIDCIDLAVFTKWTDGIKDAYYVMAKHRRSKISLIIKLK